ncbi:hypothetical protein HPP92_026665 [Vanilla planifolia]|uniref:Uncharacterized protein n=1 Tax=Vanilla planifolia TaxID=51239 RepID=A0A835U6Q0_VANPL|nr:hypothetical protein HPP92_026665 [Vanilla planifolia]
MSSSRFRELIASKWRRLASKGAKRRSKGHFAVYADGGKRFVVPLRYLDHPIFRVLLELAEEEFGTVACGPSASPARRS